MRQREVADFCADAAQAVEPGGGQAAGEAGFFQEFRLGRDDVDGSGVTVEIAEQQKQAAHERRIGVAAEMAAPGAQFAGDPGGGDAALHTVGVGALGLRQRSARPRPVDDGGEAFLGVLDQEEVVDELLLFLGQSHLADGAGRRPACKHRAGPLNRGMVNPFAISWLWRGFKGNSVTFALLFATCVLGWPLSDEFGRLLTRLGVHWLYVLMLPGFFFMWLAKREDRIIPEETKRKLYARSLIVGSVVLALLIAWWRK